MTVASETSRSGPYTGNGVTTVFDYGFRIVDGAHITVIRAQNGVETTLTLGADYSVSGVGDVGGGQVTTTAAPLTGQTLTIVRSVPFVQETDLENQGAYYAETIETALDLAAMRDQEMNEKLARTLRSPASDGVVDMTLPAAASRANRLLGFDATGAPFVISGNGPAVPQILTPLDYGGAADGATDNYSAIMSALDASDHVYLPPGTWAFGQQILPPPGKTIYGAGEGATILQALSANHNGILIQDVDGVTIRDLSLIGIFDPVGYDTGGIFLERSNKCTIDNVTIKDWSAQGLALSFASYNKIGDITTVHNGDRGVNCSGFSHHNTFGNIIGTDNGLAAFLFGWGSYQNTVNSVIGGGHKAPAIWFESDVHNNSIGRVNIGPPAAGYEDNSAVVFGWHAHRNHIGNVIARGCRRGIQFIADTVPLSGNPSIDPLISQGNTEQNTVISAWIETDNGANSAGVYFDSHNTRINTKNKIISLHVKDAVYGVWDVIGDTLQNVFVEQTFDNVTAPFSLPAFGRNFGLYRDSRDFLGFDCQDPSVPFHFRKGVTGDAGIAIENSSTANDVAKTASYEMRLCDTFGAAKVAGRVQAVPLDANALNTHIVIWARKADAEADVLKVYGTGVMDLRNGGSNPAFTLSRTDAHAANQIVAELDGAGMDSAGNPQTYGQLTVVAKVITSGAESGEWRLATFQGGALGNRVNVGGGMYHPSVTGGDKGNNTINFGAVYDDNVLLTDYVFDLHIDGKMRRYSKRVREVARKLDPAMFDPEIYAEFWRKHRRLYGMPDLNDCIDGAVKDISLGGMIQRLWQTVELQAIHIEALRVRIDA